MYKELPPADLMAKYGQEIHGVANPSFGLWNQYRRFGDQFPEESKELVFKRMDKWGLNTIANWSSPDIMAMNRKAFFIPLRGIGIEHDLMGLCDVYAPDFINMVDENLKAFVEPYKNNPWLIGYFIGNEPAWLNQEVRLCNLILNGKDRAIKVALKKFLTDKGDTPENRKDFIFSTFKTFLIDTNKILKRYDPNHLNLGIRFGNIVDLDPKILKICSEAFDILSFNSYSLYPDYAMMTQAMNITHLPMIIGEYHFGTVDRGLAQSLWQVPSEKERGVAYRYYTEKAYSHPGLIGTAYFQWCDQDLTGRFDGENYNCGLIDVTDRPYKEQVRAMMETAKQLYKIHDGTEEPFNQAPPYARGYEPIPDLWNK